VAVKRSVAWDAAKDGANLAKHGVSFEEATQVFDDTLAGYFYDDLHSDEEDRYIAVGRTIDLRVLVVVYTIREDQTRLISARPARRAEIRRYMNIDEVREANVVEKDTPLDPDDVDLSTWDWSKFRRGFGFTLKRGPKWVRLEDDVRIIFHGDEEVNEALRKMMREGRSPAPNPEKRRTSRLKNRTQASRPARSRRRS
jgi:uncharacterized DUF497 family protein